MMRRTQSAAKANTRILLTPSTDSASLDEMYRLAVREAKEVYLLTAYLTHWQLKEPLNSRCERVRFLVGTDFGLTRTLACRDLLRWLPKQFKEEVLAVGTGGFHPKMLVWKTVTGECRCVIGSSNLTDAGFHSNVEANVALSITKGEFSRITKWINELASSREVINDAWLLKYKEAILTPNSKKPVPVMKLVLPGGALYRPSIRSRRLQQRKFAKIADNLSSAMEHCAQGKLSSTEFWRRLWSIWGTHESRFMGKGFEIKGKRANWRQACVSFCKVMEKARSKTTEVEVDDVVRREIDTLKKAQNPVRGAWFSEMLCHYWPKWYPLVDAPVRNWLGKQKWRAQKGASAGSRYIELARTMRETLKQSRGLRDLAEADAVVWKWNDLRKPERPITVPFQGPL